MYGLCAKDLLCLLVMMTNSTVNKAETNRNRFRNVRHNISIHQEHICTINAIKEKVNSDLKNKGMKILQQFLGVG